MENIGNRVLFLETLWAWAYTFTKTIAVLADLDAGVFLSISRNISGQFFIAYLKMTDYTFFAWASIFLT